MQEKITRIYFKGKEFFQECDSELKAPSVLFCFKRSGAFRKSEKAKAPCNE